MNRPMRWLLSFLLCTLLVPFGRVCRAELPPNTLTKAEQLTGWKLLFDGQTAAGWRNYRKEGLSDGWVVEDGVLRRAKAGAGDIVTAGQYDDFELSLEYRVPHAGNSGLMFRVTEDAPLAWHSGPEIQIQDNVDGHDPQKAGWLYQLYKPLIPDWVRQVEQQAGLETPDTVDATRPVGEWNQLYLRIAPQQCEVAVNGVSYYYFRIGDDEWNRRVAASKFAGLPQFGKAPKGHLCLQDHGDEVAYRSIKIRELPADGSVHDPVDGRLALKGVVAFPHLKWADWEPVDERGRVRPLRPMIVTHAGDGSNRLFVATQSGMIHVFANDPAVKTTKMFVDLRPKVADWKQNNEEGMLGFAFHPRYQETGEFFVYYSSAAEPQVSIVSRFQVSSDDPNRADADSEEVLLRIPQPFANHNGGSIAFGPDGYLYIGLGDGGSRNDPFGNGQNLATWLGSILRIDVDHKQEGLNYAIPADNPFRDRADAKPEIYAYGFRNIWRLSFDRETGTLWAGDVGQDLWEEVDIVRRGGNYGWSVREGTHPFGNRMQSADDEPIDPVWEYDHQVGKSVTGGIVYRGSRLPQLRGRYLHADYVSGKIWALEYDEATGKAISNKSIATSGIPVMAFGEDEAGDVYYTIEAPDGRGIYRFEPTE